jgi:hypothetical protein
MVRSAAWPDRVAVRFGRALTSRRLVLAVFTLAIAYGLVVAFVPQQPTTGEPIPRALSALGLDHVITTWSFRVLLVVALLQLAAAAYRIARRDVRRFLRSQGPAGERFEVRDPASFAAALRRRGYLRLRRGSAVSRFVKHPWGLFGGTALHVGLLLCGVGVALVTLTRSVGLVTIAEGQALPAGTPLSDPAVGPLGAPAVLTKELALDRVDAEFWPTGEPKRYTCWYRMGSGPEAASLAVVTSRPITHEGVRYHQESRVGYAFFLTVEGPDWDRKVRLDLAQPPSASEASYTDRALDGGILLKARLRVDEPAYGQPVLTLRVLLNGRESGEATLTEGDAASIAGVRVSLDAVTRYAILTIDRSKGYWLLFPSFFVVFAGGLLLYAVVPREVTVRRLHDGRLVADWYAPRFAAWYGTELDELVSAASGGSGA